MTTVKTRSSTRSRKRPDRLAPCVDEGLDAFVNEPLEPFVVPADGPFNPRVRVWPETLLGQRVLHHLGLQATPRNLYLLQVLWDEGWYTGVITRFDKATHECKIDYDDGDVEKGILGKDLIRTKDEDEVTDKKWQLLSPDEAATSPAPEAEEASPTEVAGSTLPSSGEQIGLPLGDNQQERTLGDIAATGPPQPVGQPLPAGVVFGYPVGTYQPSAARASEGPAQPVDMDIEDQPLQFRLATSLPQGICKAPASRARQPGKAASKRRAGATAAPGETLMCRCTENDPTCTYGLKSRTCPVICAASLR